MRDAIERLRLERRITLLFAAVFLLFAALAHFLSGWAAREPGAATPPNLGETPR